MKTLRNIDASLQFNLSNNICYNKLYKLSLPNNNLILTLFSIIFKEMKKKTLNNQ